MSRLPPHPEIDWKPDGTPVARSFGDIYFSTSDGLAEARAVFLAGCGLPERWAGRGHFTVAETGFGTGLNFLALWQMWRAHRPSPAARLHFVSFEAFPLEREIAARALAAWPELAQLSEQLLEKWPHRARGVRRVDFPRDGVTLTLYIDDIARALPTARFAADAWFLDGFSPARNGEMWDSALYPQIAARTASEARAATFTVAGDVRRGLSGAGFEVAKRPGFGRKRERLEAVFTGPAPCVADTHGLRSPAEPPARVAVIGAGIAGACAAGALTSRGVAVTVFDAAPALASGASGNPLALLMPRLDAADTVQARILIDAYLAARARFREMPGSETTQVRQTPKDDAEVVRFAKLLADPPLPLEDLEAISGGGLLHKDALILRPALLLPALLEGAELRLGEAAPGDLPSYDAVIYASGMGLATCAPWLALQGKLGQVEHIAGAMPAEPSASASGHYALAAGTERLWGATFDAWEGGQIAVSEEALAHNAQGLAALQPWWMAQTRGADITSRASVRATTPDRLPVAGALPDFEAMVKLFAPLRTGQSIKADAPLVEGAYLLGGLGSRGFTFAPRLADIIAGQILGEPAPASVDQLQAISPARFVHRGLKRGLF